MYVFRISKRSTRESASSILEKTFSAHHQQLLQQVQDLPLNFGSSSSGLMSSGGPPKKVSKLENMLDKLKKRKVC